MSFWTLEVVVALNQFETSRIDTGKLLAFIDFHAKYFLNTTIILIEANHVLHN